MTPTNYADRATNYAKDVVEGRVLACKWVRLAAERHLSDIENQEAKSFPYRFDEAAANKVCRFVELMPHVKGKWAHEKQSIRLEDWQCFHTAAVFGWLRKSDGLRRYRRVYLEVPRKNGKSSWTAALGLYMFAADDEFGAEVYSGAGSQKQAWEVFGPAHKMAKRTEQFRDAYGVEVNAQNLHILANGSKFEPIIGKPGDGASPSFAITDEYHEHQTEEQYDTMVTGMGSREQPMAWVITTAGDDTAGPCYDLRTEVTQVLEGSVKNDELWGVIYTVDEDDDWTSEEALEKANPNIGVSVFREYLLSQQRDAINNPRKQSTFKTKHLNVWVTAASPFFNLEKWNRLDDAPPIEEFAGQPCWKGLDLAAKLDLTADMTVFQRNLPSTCSRCRGSGRTVKDDEGRERPAEGARKSGDCSRCGGSGEHDEPNFYVFGRYYIPETRAEEPENKHYDGWVRAGHLIATQGNITDYDEVEDGVLHDADRHRIVQLGFDPYNATHVVTHLINHGVECVEVPQNVGYLSEPMKWLEAFIEDGRIHHDGNPVLAWAISNVTAKEDRNGNVFPRKERRENKIDPAVALIIALGRALDNDEPVADPYESRGLRTIG